MKINCFPSNTNSCSFKLFQDEVVKKNQDNRKAVLKANLGGVQQFTYVSEADQIKSWSMSRLHVSVWADVASGFYLQECSPKERTPVPRGRAENMSEFSERHERICSHLLTELRARRPQGEFIYTFTIYHLLNTLFCTVIHIWINRRNRKALYQKYKLNCSTMHVPQILTGSLVCTYPVYMFEIVTFTLLCSGWKC